MSRIANTTFNQGLTIIDFVSQAKYRNTHDYDADKLLDFCKKIAKLKDPSARKIGVELISMVEELMESNDMMHHEFDSLLPMLSALDTNIDKDTENLKKGVVTF